jgi:CubicO group peptidase (beta-lactamase class C family)
VTADGQVSAHGVGTTGDGERVTADTRFAIARTKSFTALAVAQLVDDGVVDLDDPVRRHVPELRLADGAGDAITVRHLLQHTSGLTTRRRTAAVLRHRWHRAGRRRRARRHAAG